MDWKGIFLTAEGRMGRREFWIGFAMIFVASIVLGMIPILGQIIGLLLIWPQVCIHAKRLHDMNYTGWLMIIPFGVSCMAIVFAMMSGGLAALTGEVSVMGAAMGMAFLAFGFAALLGLAFLLWVGLTPGQVGENRFGLPVPARI